MFSLKRLATASVAALTFAACSDSTSPDSVNTATMANEMNQLATTFDNNAAFQSMASMLLYFPSGAPAAALRATLPFSPALARGAMPGLSAGQAIRAARPRLAPTDAQIIIPIDARGIVYVFNPDSGQYVASNQAGAPPNGLRIMLYTINDNGQPVLPLAELGYLDLIDESNASGDRLHVILKLGATTISDYTIVSQPGVNSQRLTATGYLRNVSGTEQVNYTLMSYENFGTGVGDFEYTLTAQGGAQVLIDSHDNGDLTGSTLIEVSHGGNTMTFDITDTASGFNGDILFNGTLVATVSRADGQEAVFTGADGRPLSQQEIGNLAIVLGVATLFLLITLANVFLPVFLFV